jgi:hypothetical protein
VLASLGVRWLHIPPQHTLHTYLHVSTLQHTAGMSLHEIGLSGFQHEL